jgi:hypothetical protein
MEPEMSNEPKYPDVAVRLVGFDANVFAIIGTVAKALRRTKGEGAAEAYRVEAMNAASYDEVLQITMRTVEVE